MARYRRMKDGEWFAPKRNGYKMACCDCGLVHTLDFRLVPHGGGKRIILRARRHARATTAMRAADARKPKTWRGIVVAVDNDKERAFLKALGN